MTSLSHAPWATQARWKTSLLHWEGGICNSGMPNEPFDRCRSNGTARPCHSCPHSYTELSWMGPPIHVIRDFLLNPAGQLPSFHLGFSRPACTIPDDIMSLYCVHYPIVGFARFPGGWDIKHGFPFLNVDVSHVCSEFYRSKIRTTEQASYGAFK